jgi:RNA polymerase sigma factor (sigma-70 family)
VNTAGEQFSPTDAELISSCRRDDVAAWQALVGRYGSMVYSVCRASGLGEADAADITQQTFSILHDSLDRLAADTRLGGWLATVARRHCWRLRARQQRETAEAPDELARRIEAGSDAAEVPAAWEQLEWLHHGLSLLDERCRELLTELYLRPEPADYAEVAKRLQMAVGSIGPTRARCLEKLRALLESA